MQTPRPAKAPARRFDPERLTERQLARMAWNPSYLAPSIHDVHDALFVPPGPPALGGVESRLRAEVISNPDSDAPRLAYAEWCDAQRDERGTFIRLQLERGSAPPSDRELELLARYGSLWCRE